MKRSPNGHEQSLGGAWGFRCLHCPALLSFPGSEPEPALFTLHHPKPWLWGQLPSCLGSHCCWIPEIRGWEGLHLLFHFKSEKPSICLLPGCGVILNHLARVFSEVFVNSSFAVERQEPEEFAWRITSEGWKLY